MIIVIGWLRKGPEGVGGLPDGNPVLDCLLIVVGVHGGGPRTADGEIPVGGDLVHLLNKDWSFDKEFGLAASFFFYVGNFWMGDRGKLNGSPFGEKGRILEEEIGFATSFFFATSFLFFLILLEG